MAAAAAALLDELMGRDRNLDPSQKSKSIRWDSSQVCKYYIVKFCPHDLFVNTKADLGACDKVHDESLRKEFMNAPRYHQLAYEDEFVKFCQSMLSDVEKRIKRGRQRLAINAMEAPSPKDGDEKIKSLTERINTLLEQVENLGCEGKVEEAQDVMKLCEDLKRERDMLRRGSDNHWLQVSAEIAAAQEKQMEVCEVCGAFLIVGDAQQRVDDHLMGKQHMGYARIKVAMEEILSKREKDKEERERQREKEREERRKQREGDSDGGGGDSVVPDAAVPASAASSESRSGGSRRDNHRRGGGGDENRRGAHRRNSSRDRGGGRGSSRRSRSRSRDRYRRRSRSSDRRPSHRSREEGRSRRSNGSPSSRDDRRAGSSTSSKSGRHRSRDRDEGDRRRRRSPDASSSSSSRRRSSAHPPGDSDN